MRIPFKERVAALPPDDIEPEMRERRVLLCEECGVNPADWPWVLCPGCEAYLEHAR